MADDRWVTLRLGTICTKIGSGATPRGGSDVYLDNGPYALVRSQNVHNDGFHYGGLAFIEEKHAAELCNVEVKKDDVLLNITGDSVARCCQVDPSILPARVNQHVAIIRTDPDKLNTQFLRYLIISPEMQARLLSWAGSGGTRNALTKGMIESLEVLVPENVAEQHAIAYILGTLDDKIELNRRMSETLELTARALFKSWFVNFDPVRAKAEGRDTGLPNPFTELFPDRFEDSELGEIPAEWRVAPLDEIATYLNGLALQNFPPNSEGSLPVIKIAQLRAGNTKGADETSAAIPTDYIVDDGDILFSWSGSLEVEVWCGGRGALNQHLFKITSTRFPKWFYLYWTRQHLADFRRIAAGKATTMGHIQRSHLSAAKALVPPAPLLQSMTESFAPLVNGVIAKCVESRILTALRDTLLPKLISGELRVKDAERFIRRMV